MTERTDIAQAINYTRRRFEHDAQLHDHRALQFGLLATTFLSASVGLGILAWSASAPLVMGSSVAAATATGLIGSYAWRATLDEKSCARLSQDSLNLSRNAPQDMEKLLLGLEGSSRDMDQVVRWVDRIASKGDSVKVSDRDR